MEKNGQKSGKASASTPRFVIKSSPSKKELVASSTLTANAVKQERKFSQLKKEFKLVYRKAAAMFILRRRTATISRIFFGAKPWLAALLR